MTLREIFEHVLIMSGACAVGEANIELNIDQFKMIVNQCVAYADKYDPDVIKITVSSGAGRAYTFTGSEDPRGYNRIPKWISDAVPIGGTSGSSLPGNWNTILGWVNPMSLANHFVWSYNGDILYLDRGGSVQLDACYGHPAIPIEQIFDVEGGGQQKKVIDYNYPTIDLHKDPFLYMVQGYFMQGIGRFRRAFTLQDLPVTLDASQLTDEGTRIVEESKRMYTEDSSKFFLAIR